MACATGLGVGTKLPRKKACCVARKPSCKRRAPQGARATRTREGRESGVARLHPLRLRRSLSAACVAAGERGAARCARRGSRLGGLHRCDEAVEELDEGGVVGLVDVVDVPQAGLAYLGPLGV